MKYRIEIMELGERYATYEVEADSEEAAKEAYLDNDDLEPLTDSEYFKSRDCDIIDVRPAP